MDDLHKELDRLLSELAEMDRCAAGDTGASVALLTIARRGTKLAIAEVRSLIARTTAVP